jgi:hypothetical protein
MIVTPESATPRCTCTVDLISKVMRPYLFRVVVTGEYPHAYREVFTVSAPDENSAAIKGMEVFCRMYGREFPDGVVSAAPKARLA